MQQPSQALYDGDIEEEQLSQPSAHGNSSDSAHTHAETSTTRDVASGEILEIESMEE